MPETVELVFSTFISLPATALHVPLRATPFSESVLTTVADAATKSRSTVAVDVSKDMWLLTTLCRGFMLESVRRGTDGVVGSSAAPRMLARGAEGVESPPSELLLS